MIEIMDQLLIYVLNRGVSRGDLTFHLTEKMPFMTLYRGIKIDNHEFGLFEYSIVLEDRKSHKFYVFTELGIKEQY